MRQGLLFDTPILAAGHWPTNGDLIADVARIYIGEDDAVLDPTYGRGRWWTRTRPLCLTTHDLTIDGVDFRHLPHDNDTFDVVAFDPPYLPTGGRSTSTIDDFNDRFGLHTTPPTVPEWRLFIGQGMAECVRVLKPGGHLLQKCMDFINGGRFQPATSWVIDDARHLGLELVDRFEHVGRCGPQPPGRRQVHARRNLSTLLVLRKEAAS